MTKLSQGRKLLADYVAQPLVLFLTKIPFITPNAITWFSFLISLGAAGLIVAKYLFAAGWVLLFAGFLDILDGALARHTNQVTRFGALLDSVLDRLSEAAPLLGLLIFSLGEQLTLELLLVGTTLIGSFLVSYVKARAEGLGLECQVGLFTRAERVVVFSLGLIFSHFSYSLIIALAVITFFSFITAGQRILYIWQQTKTG